MNGGEEEGGEEEGGEEEGGEEEEQHPKQWRNFSSFNTNIYYMY